MSNDDLTWLDLPSTEVAKMRARPEYASALKSLRALDWRQRLYLDCLLDSQLETGDAVKLLKERHGIAINSRTVRKWIEGEPPFREAVTRLQDFAAGGLAVSKAATFAKLNKLANDCRKVIRFEDKQGNVFDRPVDAGAAHSALVTLSKLNGALFAETEQNPTPRQLPTIVVQIVGAAPLAQVDVIEGESEEVP
jgi:hypothetical protein